MAQAIEAGIRHFIIGLGGSSTSDCGVGMLQALGYIFRDAQGKPIGLGGQEVGRIASVDDSQVLPALQRLHLRCCLRCDSIRYSGIGVLPIPSARKAGRRRSVKSRTTPGGLLPPSPGRIPVMTSVRQPVPVQLAVWDSLSWPTCMAGGVQASRSLDSIRLWHRPLKMPITSSPVKADSTPKRPWARLLLV